MTTPPDPQAAAIRIGLTGNIATGKTTVGRMLEALGAELIDADQVSHAVMAPGGPAYGPVVAAFGDGILAEDDEIDPVASPPIGHAADPPIDHEVDRSVSRKAERMINRAALGRLVFSDPDALARLEALVHPVVIAEVERRIADSAARVIVVEAIKLLESGMAETYDAIWVTTCSESTQLARLMEGRGLSREAALARIHAQPPQAEKLARADWVIETDGTLAQTEMQVREGWQRLARGSTPDRGFGQARKADALSTGF